MVRKGGAETVLVTKQLGKEVIRSSFALTVSICKGEIQWLFREGGGWVYRLGEER
jgi:hypothetical protein